MGFLKSVRALSAMGKEIERTQPPMADRLAGAMSTIEQSQALMASLTEATTLEAGLRARGGSATAVVTAVTGGHGAVDMAPILEFDLVVQAPGRTPTPARVRAPISQHLLYKVVPGAQVPVLVDPASPRVALDTAALGAA
jgi:hypothetical protein